MSESSDLAITVSCPCLHLLQKKSQTFWFDKNNHLPIYFRFSDKFSYKLLLRGDRGVSLQADRQLKFGFGPWDAGAIEPYWELSKARCSSAWSESDVNMRSHKGDLEFPSSPHLWGSKFSAVIPRCGFHQPSLRFHLRLQKSPRRLVERHGWALRTCRIYYFILYQSAGGIKLLWKGNRWSWKVSDFGKVHLVQRLFYFTKFQLQLSSPPHTQTKSSQCLNQPFKTFFWLEANCSFAFWEIRRVSESLKPSLNLDLRFLLIKLLVIWYMRGLLLRTRDTAPSPSSYTTKLAFFTVD